MDRVQISDLIDGIKILRKRKKSPPSSSKISLKLVFVFRRLKPKNFLVNKISQFFRVFIHAKMNRHKGCVIGPKLLIHDI